ncbi:hypothetical protein EDD37DRAFT_696768 [Exophiala viscosa]|uniref:uncharacterized protein n=1 Tax=Exophiala viscosa TaxID=2486360 RepID=UPI00218D7F2A|nr:hypothetical protein EDD37DRAFT_696768 [Exophiala viscosa]
MLCRPWMGLCYPVGHLLGEISFSTSAACWLRKVSLMHQIGGLHHHGMVTGDYRSRHLLSRAQFGNNLVHAVFETARQFPARSPQTSRLDLPPYLCRQGPTCEVGQPHPPHQIQQLQQILYLPQIIRSEQSRAMSLQDSPPNEYFLITFSFDKDDADEVAGVGFSLTVSYSQDTTVKILLLVCLPVHLTTRTKRYHRSGEDHITPEKGLVVRLLVDTNMEADQFVSISKRHILEDVRGKAGVASVEVSGPARHIQPNCAWLERGGEWYEIDCNGLRDGYRACRFIDDHGTRWLRNCTHGDECPEDDGDADGDLTTVRQLIVPAGSGEKIPDVPPITKKPPVWSEYDMKFPDPSTQDRETKRPRT